MANRFAGIPVGEEKTSRFAGEAANNFPGAGVIEPALAIGSALGSTVVGGLAGIGAAANPFAEQGAGGRTVDAIQQAGTFSPKTQAGQQNLKAISDFIQQGIDLVNVPLSHVGGVIELANQMGKPGGPSLEQVNATINSIQSDGVSPTLGDRIFEETGSPVAGAAGQIALGVIGGKGLLGASRGAGSAAKGAAPIVQGLFQYQSPAKQQIAQLLVDGSSDKKTARFKLVNRPISDVTGENGVLLLEDLRDVAGGPATKAAPPNRSKLAEFLNIGGPRVASDELAIEAIQQGFDERVVAALKGASSGVKKRALKMVSVQEKGLRDIRFQAEHRPGGVVGDSLLDRFEFVKKQNAEAGIQIDKIAKELKGSRSDFSPAVNEFLSDLDNMDVFVSKDFKPFFGGSRLEGDIFKGSQNILSSVMKRMSETKSPDAHDMHRFKKFLDANLFMGKSNTQIDSKLEIALGSLRKNIDGILDKDYPQYNEVNTRYSDTITALNAVQDVAGKKVDLRGGRANETLGVKLRRVLSNSASRDPIIDSVYAIDRVAAKYGGEFDDDILTLITLADELDAVFGPAARTSLQGQTSQALKQGINQAADLATGRFNPLDAAAGVASRVTERSGAIDNDKALKAIKKLLER